MKLLLAGMWPQLKPLPVFKFETVEYRASLDFDKMRGEWVCRRTFFPSNKVQELRGGLPEIISALPHGLAEVFAECAAAKHQELDLDKDASRRLRAMLQWRENYENGAFYSGLRDYLSESQRDEIDEILRLTLTARQLQFSPKNVAYVFDALSKAGGKLATLLEIAQRNKREQQPALPARAEAAAPGVEPLVPLESLIPATLESSQEEPVASGFTEQDPSSRPRLLADDSSQTSTIGTPEILDANPPSLAEDLQKKVHHHTPGAGLPVQVRTRSVKFSADRIEDSPSPKRVLEITGFQVTAFASIFLFAVISVTLALTVGHGPLGVLLRDAQKSMLAVDATSPALPDRRGEATPRLPTPPAGNSFFNPDKFPDTNKLDDVTAPEAKPRESTREPEFFPKESPAISTSSPTIETKGAVDPKGILARNGSDGPLARNASPLVSPEHAYSPGAASPRIGAPANSAPRRVAPSKGTSPHRSPPAAILVTTPARGSKPFRVTFPEKPIAASSSFAMTSELSVLVPPQPGLGAAHKSARLQAGELVSFVWPRYPRTGDRHGQAETIKVRTTIGQFGQVLDIKLVSGSLSLLPATVSALRQWRFRPTLLNKRPVQVQQDITIAFRPPQYLSQVRSQHPSQN